jgi:hypothetical protein
VAVIVLLLVGALYLLGRSTGGGGGDGSTAAQTTTGRTTTTPVPASTAKKKPTTSSSSSSSGKKKSSSSSSSSKLVRLQVIGGPGSVFACLVDSSGQERINGATLSQGQTGGPYRSRSFRLLLGNGNARLRVDGKLKTVPDASPVAFKISKGSFKRVDPATVPNCG